MKDQYEHRIEALERERKRLKEDVKDIGIEIRWLRVFVERQKKKKGLEDVRANGP